MNLGACSLLTLAPLTGYWFRAIDQRHWKSRLSTGHTRTNFGRFHLGSARNPSYEILYLAESHLHARFEVGALLGTSHAPIPNPAETWTVLNLEVILRGVADLTDPHEQKRIGTSAQELTGKWNAYKKSGKAPTQLLGSALFDLPDLEGFVVPTAVPGVSGCNLIVFPQKLQPSSRIEFRNPMTGVIERLSL